MGEGRTGVSRGESSGGKCKKLCGALLGLVPAWCGVSAPPSPTPPPSPPVLPTPRPPFPLPLAHRLSPYSSVAHILKPCSSLPPPSAPCPLIPTPQLSMSHCSPEVWQMAKAILHANEHPSANGTGANGDPKPTYTHHRPRSPTRFSRPSAAAAASPFLTDKGQRSHLLGSFGSSSSECFSPSLPPPSPV